MQRILLVEDEEGFVSFMKKGLSEEGYRVDYALDGEKGLKMLLEEEFDLVILDVMIPRLDGFSLLKKLRKTHGNNTPVIMLTAKGEINDKLTAFEAGCDDYLTKPFSFDELLVRIKAVTKRVVAPPKKEQMKVKDLVIDPLSRRVFRGASEIELTKTEFDLFEYLLRNANHALSRSNILTHVWDYTGESNTNLVDVHIKSLRGKVDQSVDDSLIKTVRGIGYMIELS